MEEVTTSAKKVNETAQELKEDYKTFTEFIGAFTYFMMWFLLGTVAIVLAVVIAGSINNVFSWTIGGIVTVGVIVALYIQAKKLTADEEPKKQKE